LASPAESTYLATNDFQIKTRNVWRSSDLDLYPATHLDLYEPTMGDKVSANVSFI